jgi:hypothetical protein
MEKTMSISRLASAAAVAAMLASPVLVSASDSEQIKVASKPASTVSSKTVPASPMATLKGVKAVPMSPSELQAVKGQHVHFITISNGKLHLAGDIKTENNWSNEWGGSDGHAVAPSYHGLCVAHGNGGIFIPTGPPGAPVTLQCPAGS